MNKKGFTLVEIMIVVLIIGLLAAIAIPNFIKARKTTQMNACIDNMRNIVGAVEQAKLEGIPNPVESDLIGSDKYIKVMPTCPVNQEGYELEGAGADNWVPTCPAKDSDHVLPSGAGAVAPTT